MNNLVRITFTTMLLFAGAPLTAANGPCDAYFTFDDTLADSGGNGYDGEMIGAKGEPVTARYTEGRYGKALMLDGNAAMRALVDLHWDVCPRVTISAWINVSRDSNNTSPVMFSTGQGSGPGLYFSKNWLKLNGTENGIYQPRAVRPGTWLFVAGVYDYEEGVYELYWGGRGPASAKLSDARYEPEDAFWIGTENDTWGSLAGGFAVDELRITGARLGKEDVQALHQRVPTTTVESAIVAAPEGTQLPGDQYQPIRLPGDQYEPTQLPGDQYHPIRLPGDQYEPTQLPGDQYQPIALPGDQYDPTQLPGDQYEPAQLPGDQMGAEAAEEQDSVMVNLEKAGEQ